MRGLAACLAALILGACGQIQDQSAAPACARSATHEVMWTSAEAPDVIVTRAEGPTCAQAVVTFVARNADGDPLWAFASTYFDMIAGGAPPEGAPAVSDQEMDRFLTGWADVTVMQSGELPQWREGVATLTESAGTFAYETPFDRETYEMLRGRNLTTICYASATEATQCLVLDPFSNAPTMMVAYGP